MLNIIVVTVVVVDVVEVRLANPLEFLLLQTQRKLEIPITIHTNAVCAAAYLNIVVIADIVKQSIVKS